jgi:hypothetical protein
VLLKALDFFAQAFNLARFLVNSLFEAFDLLALTNQGLILAILWLFGCSAFL